MRERKQQIQKYTAWNYYLAVLFHDGRWHYLMNDDGEVYQFDTLAEAERMFAEVLSHGTPDATPEERGGKLVIFRESRSVVRVEP